MKLPSSSKRIESNNKQKNAKKKTKKKLRHKFRYSFARKFSKMRSEKFTSLAELWFSNEERRITLPNRSCSRRAIRFRTASRARNWENKQTRPSDNWKFNVGPRSGKQNRKTARTFGTSSTIFPYCFYSHHADPRRYSEQERSKLFRPAEKCL